MVASADAAIGLSEAGVIVTVLVPPLPPSAILPTSDGLAVADADSDIALPSSSKMVNEMGPIGVDARADRVGRRRAIGAGLSRAELAAPPVVLRRHGAGCVEDCAGRAGGIRRDMAVLQCGRARPDRHRQAAALPPGARDRVA